MKRYLVDSAAIHQNLETLKKRAGKARLFAVVKGNGYGLVSCRWPPSAGTRVSTPSA